MAYATFADLLHYATVDELIELTTDDDGAAQPDETMIGALLEHSSGEIDSHLPAGVTVPEGSTVAARVVCMLTLFHLYSRRASLMVTESRQKQFEFAQDWLFQLSLGGVNP